MRMQKILPLQEKRLAMTLSKGPRLPIQTGAKKQKRKQSRKVTKKGEKKGGGGGYDNGGSKRG